MRFSPAFNNFSTHPEKKKKNYQGSGDTGYPPEPVVGIFLFHD
jgi:hypothetical protein